MLVRTSSKGKKQQGITFLLLDRTDFPGMDIRPIKGLDGHAEFCEVFFDNVRVPQSGRVGAENEGWSVAKHLLKHERNGSANSPVLVRYLKRITEAAQDETSPFGGKLSDDPVFQRDLGALYADVATLAQFEWLIMSGQEMVNDPALPSIAKTMNSELIQRVSVMMTRVAGLEGLSMQLEALAVGSGVDPMGSELDLISMPFYLNSRATTIYAGTNEVQRDLIARSLPIA